MVVKLMSYKALFTIIVAYNLEIKQINVKIVFFYSDININIFIYQLIGFDNSSRYIYKLNKALYSLKQSL